MHPSQKADARTLVTTRFLPSRFELALITVYLTSNACAANCDICHAWYQATRCVQLNHRPICSPNIWPIWKVASTIAINLTFELVGGRRQAAGGHRSTNSHRLIVSLTIEPCSSVDTAIFIKAFIPALLFALAVFACHIAARNSIIG